MTPCLVHVSRLTTISTMKLEWKQEVNGFDGHGDNVIYHTFISFGAQTRTIVISFSVCVTF